MDSKDGSHRPLYFNIPEDFYNPIMDLWYSLLEYRDGIFFPLKPERLSETPVKKFHLDVLLFDIVRKFDPLKNVVLSPAVLFYNKLVCCILNGMKVPEHLTPLERIAFHGLLAGLNESISRMCGSTLLFNVFFEHCQIALDRIKNLMHLFPDFSQVNLTSRWLANFIQDMHVGSDPRIFNQENQWIGRPIPIHTSLGSSGMGLITEALLLIKSAWGNEKLTILLTQEIYYELQSVAQDIFFDDLLLSTYLACEQLTHVIITEYQTNVNRKKSGHHSNDVCQLISSQFNLRQLYESDIPLIVVLDSTMNSIADDNMATLLLNHREKITSGQLIIIDIYSLNKSFQLGLDMSPAGCCTCYFNPHRLSEHPQFQRIVTHYNSTRILASDMKQEDITVRWIAHMMTYAKDAPLAFHNLLRQSALAIGNIIPDTLKKLSAPCRGPFIKLDPMVSKEGDESWAFISLRPYNMKKELQDAIETEIAIELRKLFMYRDGYAFGLTTYALIKAPHSPFIFRISIGAEPEEALIPKMLSLFDYLQQLNARMKSDENKTSPVTRSLLIRREGIFFTGIKRHLEEPHDERGAKRVALPR
ncbi:MAG: hypothetical protein A3F10_03290 [Coxiella sp. RIFCSPHIGHO2_12_FULL_42_15]|nr:MAG: hypothetical protein A3F10_03290 [Coxiella sp. RIFCSPHIGHO2_12_FULL_42_15]